MRTRAITVIEILLQVCLAVSGLYVVILSGPAGAVLWCLIALAYVVVRLIRLRLPTKGSVPTVRSIRTRLAFAMLASLVGLTGALNAVLMPASYGFDAVAVPMILLAWAVLHFGYACRCRVNTDPVAPRRVQLVVATPGW